MYSKKKVLREKPGNLPKTWELVKQDIFLLSFTRYPILEFLICQVDCFLFNSDFLEIVVMGVIRARIENVLVVECLEEKNGLK